MKKSLFTLCALLALVCLFSGCASGPSYSAYKDKIAALEAGKGRVYFYRVRSMMGAAVQPSVMIDDTIQAGKSVPGGFFFYDLAPGDHTVDCSTEAKKKTNFSIKEGQTIYFKTVITMGFAVGRVTPILQDEEVGKKELAECKYEPLQK